MALYTSLRKAPALILALAASAALSGCDYYDAPRGPAARDWMARARVTGPDQSCIPLTQINQTVVRDARTIDFLSSPNRGWRNRLTSDCPGLASEKAITYATSLSQLCSTDIVYVLENWGGSPRRGASCSLGQFTPIDMR